MRNGGVVGAVVVAVICSLGLGGCAASAESAGDDSNSASASHARDVARTTSVEPIAAPTAGTAAEEDAQHLAVEPAVESPSPPPAPAEDDSDVGVAAPPVARCADEQLTLAYRARPQDSGAGSFWADLVFTNVSASDCSFAGWPGLIAQDAAGGQLGGPGLAEGTTWQTVVLAGNGGVATSTLHGTNPGAYGCPTATSTTLRAYLSSDGAGPGVAVAQAIPVCADRTSTLGVGALVAG